MALSGSCEYCGQSMVLSEDKYPLLDPENQEAIDAVVTGLCDCPQAKSERRKAETQKKIEEFIDQEVAPEAQEFARDAVELVRSQMCDSVTLQTNDGWKISVKLNKDYETVISCKKSLSKKAVY